MAVDFASLLYLQCQDQYARDVTILPVVSAPAAGAYAARGIFATRDIMIQTDFGAVVSDQETILDILDNEFFAAGQALPQQGDLINIPADGNIPDEGDWEVVSTSRNGGGETTLTIRKYELSAP